MFVCETWSSMGHPRIRGWYDFNYCLFHTLNINLLLQTNVPPIHPFNRYALMISKKKQNQLILETISYLIVSHKLIASSMIFIIKSREVERKSCSLVIKCVNCCQIAYAVDIQCNAAARIQSYS